MAIEYFDKHADAAKALLLGQFKGKPNIEGLLDVVAPQFNDLDKALVDLGLLRILGTAEGAQLDQLAAVVNIERGNSSDEELLARIQAEIRLIRGSGTVEDILTVLVLILGSSATIELKQYFPASFVVTIGETDIAELLAGFIARARGAAIGGQLVYTATDEADTFYFSSGDTEEASSTQGWADDAQTTGGELADVEEA